MKVKVDINLVWVKLLAAFLFLISILLIGLRLEWVCALFLLIVSGGAFLGVLLFEEKHKLD